MSTLPSESILNNCPEFVVVFLNDTFKPVTFSKLELTSTFAVTNLPIFWSSIGSIDSGVS